MEGNNNKEEEESSDSEEQVSDHFTCAVCLDLLYKPVVLVCGHVTCFWCCHLSMDTRGESHCPLCRHPYRYFPAICRMLDIFLKKMYPVSYARRKRQTLEDKEQSALDCLISDEEVDHPMIVEQPSDIKSEDSMSINPSSTIEGKSKHGSSAENCKQITLADVLCAACKCKQLLFRPVALNCGHVYCEACITIPEDGVIKCQVCDSRHPSGFPKVCKELENVLQEQFSSDYALRSSTQLSQEQIQSGNSLTGSDEGSKFPTGENFLQWWTVHGSKFHPGVGCDICGMCPIIGERYQCIDCKETSKSGYDLCGDCHGAGSKLPGRFNQKHTPEHRLELIKPVINRDIIYTLLSGQLAVVSAASRSQSYPGNGRSESASTSIVDFNGDNNEDEDGDEDDDGDASKPLKKKKMNQNQNPQIETNDLTFCPSFNCYSSNTTSAAALKISSSLPNQDDLYHDNEFNFVIEDNKSSPTTTIYPLFNQKENVCDTLQNLFITEREDDTSSSSEEEGNENENENEPVFCVWRGSTKSDPSSSSSVALTKCKKSSSTGSGSGSGSGSKRWRIRDLLLRRSNSEGKDQQPISNMLLSQHSNNKKVVEAVTKQKRNSVECSVNNERTKPSSPSVHEIFYVQNRAKTEDGKRRSYLPYRQGLVGFFSNGNGKGKSFPF